MDYIRTLRRRWRWLVASLALGGCLASLFMLEATPMYSAKSQLLVSSAAADSVSGLVQGGSFVQTRVPSYVDLVNSSSVLDALARRNGGRLRLDPNRISASNPLGTALINITVRDPSPRRAYDLAQAISDVFGSVIANTEATPAATSPVRVAVVRRAELPRSPDSPRKGVVLPLGVLVGLAVGIAGALLRDSADTRIASLEDLPPELGLAALGSVELGGGRSRRRSAAASSFVSSRRAEGYRKLRTNLHFQGDRHLGSILFVDPLPNSRTAAVSFEYAITMGLTGARVLLVDANLRSGRLTQLLDLNGHVGLPDVLAGKVDRVMATVRCHEAGLDVVPAGGRPQDPSERLGSDAMIALLAELEKIYDVVILDAPPLLSFTDAAVLAALASGTVLLITVGQVTQDQLRQSVRTLTPVRARLLGSLLVSKRVERWGGIAVNRVHEQLQGRRYRGGADSSRGNRSVDGVVAIADRSLDARVRPVAPFPPERGLRVQHGHSADKGDALE